MKTRYGDLTDAQIKYQKKKMHNEIHWMLIYQENDYPYLDSYIQALLFKIAGLNSLLLYPPHLAELLSLIESARLELEKSDFNFKVYRKAILDAHGLIDIIFNEGNTHE